MGEVVDRKFVEYLGFDGNVVIEVEGVAHGEGKTEVVLVGAAVDVFESSAERDAVGREIVAHPSTKVDFVATIAIVVESYSAVEHPVVFEEITTFSVHAKAEATAVVVVDAEVGERGIDIVGVLLKLCARTDGEAHEEEQESEDFFHEKRVVISDNRL